MSSVFDDDEDLYSELVDRIQDDKLLCDLHLNSALNLDQLDFEMSGNSKYNMIKNKRISASLKHCKERMTDISRSHGELKGLNFNSSPGYISVKTELSDVEGEMTELHDTTSAKILEHLDSGLRQRGYHTHFKSISNSIHSGKLKVPRCLFETFNLIMSLCLCVSEKIRGGSKPSLIGASVVDNDGFLYVVLTSQIGRRIILGTDGTTVLAKVSNTVSITIWEDLLALMDTIGQRICSAICHQIGRLIQEPGSIEWDIHRPITVCFDELLNEFGNPGYKFIGMFETLCVSVLLMKAPDGVNDPTGLLQNMMAELKEISEETGCSYSTVQNTFNRLTEKIGSLSESQVSNIFCEYRIWGHPYVDVHAGMSKVHKIGTQKKTITDFYPRYMIRHFKESVILGLYKQNGKYPPSLRSQFRDYTGDSYLIECIRDNMPVERYKKQYVIEDMDDVELHEVFKIPNTYDLTHVLNDKAISPKISEIVKTVEKGLSLERMEGRRGIISWLQGSTMNCRAFLRTIEHTGMSHEDLVIGMYEKEREMKVEARMFALMSETMRYYFVITEGLIADFLLPLFPQITMKDSLNKLQKKFWTAGAGKNRGRYDTNINIDFSKWNTNMRGALMTPLFREMDKLFGMTNVISRTHEIFESSLIYSCSGKYFPKVINGDIIEDGVMCYRGHLGGMEGLRQKGWTIGTVCLIDHVAKECGTKYKLMGQGDNQIIKILMNESLWRQCDWTEEVMEREARLKSDEFLHKLEAIFDQVGLPVKPRECWRSTNLFMYGKAMLLGGRVLSQWSKKLLRSYALSNEGTLTVGGTIGTIASNCMSSCVTMEKPQLGYACFVILGSWTLDFLFKYHPFSRAEDICNFQAEVKIPSKKPKQDSPPISAFLMKSIILLVPSICGGSVTIPFTSYIVRGFPDPASEAYSWLKLLKTGCCKGIAEAISNFYSYLMPTTIPLKQLSASPLSINHVRVLSPVLSAKKESLEFVRKMYSETNNIVSLDKEIGEIYEGVDIESELITDPVNPLLFSDLCALFPHRVSEDLLSRVSSTRTIKKLSIVGAETPIITTLQDAEINFLLYLRWRVTQKGEVYSECATQHVRIMRDVGWGREISGVTTPHPLEMTKISCYQGVSCEEESDFIYILRDDAGGFSPYLGSTVRNKVRGSGDENIRGEPLLKHIVKLATYANWMGLGKNYKKLLMSLVALYGGDRVEEIVKEIMSTEGNFSGSVDHRYQSGMMSDGSFINYAAHIGAMIFLSSDSMIEYGRGNTNYTLQFQALYCWIQFVSQLTGITRSGHCHITCKTCVVPVNDHIEEINYDAGIVKDETGPLIRSVLGLYEESTHMYLAQMPESTELKETCPFKRIHPDLIPSSCLRLSLTVYMALKIGLGMMRDCLEDSETFELGLADLQKYPRIYGKKIYLDELLKITAHILIILACISRKSGTHGQDLYKAKRYVLNRLSHLNLSQLATLGSLTLEKSILDWESYKGNRSDSACFPVTMTEHLYSTLSSLRKYVASIGDLRGKILPTRLYLPYQDISDSEMTLALISVELLEYKTSNLMMRYVKTGSLANMLEVDKCFQVIVRAYKKIRFSDCVCDKMFKLLSTCNSVPRDIYLAPIPNIDTWAEIPLRNGCRKSSSCILQPINGLGNHTLREIVLPTSSVYKWEEFCTMGQVAKHVIVLGDGTGTSSYILASRFKDSFFYPMGLFESKDITPQDLGALSPPVSRGVKNVSNAACLYIPDDINNDHFVPTLKRFIENFQEDVTIVSDIELSGGSIISHRVLNSLLDLGCHLVLKGYLKEVLNNEMLAMHKFDQFNLLTFTLGNIEYREVVLEMTPGDTGYIDTMDIVRNYDLTISCQDQDSIIERTRFISNVHGYLRELSYNLALRHLDSLGFFVDRDTVLWEAGQLLMYLYMFVNTHFLFSAESVGLNKKRLITPERRRKIERLFLIFFYITTPYGLDKYQVSFLKLVHKTPKTGDNKTFKKQLTFVHGHEVNLTKKDVQTAQALGCLRIRNNLPIRRVEKYSPVMSDKDGECLGFLSKSKIRQELYLSSGTFDSGCRYMMEG